MDSRKAMTDLALIAVFAALIAAFSWIAFSVPGSPVPITLQSLAITVAALVLGGWRGFSATALYVLVGLAGLPVFAGGAAGFGILAKASAGYLLSFPFAALLMGLAAQWLVRRGVSGARLTGGLIGASLVVTFLFIHPIGILGMMRNAHIPFDKAFLADLAFWPGDAVKCVVAALVAVAVHKAFPRMFAARRTAAPAAPATSR